MFKSDISCATVFLAVMHIFYRLILSKSIKKIFFILLGLIITADILIIPPAMANETAIITLAWEEHPDTNKDLAGFRIYYGSSSGNYNGEDSPIDVSLSNLIDIKNPEVSVSLPFGTNYLALSAYDSSNNESQYSDELVVAVASSTDSLDTGSKSLNETSEGNTDVSSVSGDDSSAVTADVSSSGGFGCSSIDVSIKNNKVYFIEALLNLLLLCIPFILTFKGKFFFNNKTLT